MSDDVAGYYNRNTRVFLARGEGGGEGVLHRAVWGEGVASRSEAFHFAHGLILLELERGSIGRPRILDLGCGVGASLLHLLDRSGGEGFGISNSEAQLEIARGHDWATWIAGDFEVDPLPPGIDLAYGIESFVHAKSASGFFENVAKALRPGARLVLIDDFLEAGADDLPPVRELARGWHARSLLSPEEVDRLAAEVGLSLVSDRDLTPFLSIDRPRDLAIACAVTLLRPFRLTGDRYLSLLGGNALRQCLKRGLVRYRARVWEKRAVS
jgi:SAM-dependent methyltransferase